MSECNSIAKVVVSLDRFRLAITSDISRIANSDFSGMHKEDLDKLVSGLTRAVDSLVERYKRRFRLELDKSLPED